MPLIEPTITDRKYDLIFKTANNLYVLCVNEGKVGMQEPIVGDRIYTLYYKIALNAYVLGT